MIKQIINHRDHPPTVRTEQEIDQDRINWNKNFLATEIAKKKTEILK